MEKVVIESAERGRSQLGMQQEIQNHSKKPYQVFEYLLLENKSYSGTTSAVCRMKHCYQMTLQYSSTQA